MSNKYAKLKHYKRYLVRQQTIDNIFKIPRSVAYKKRFLQQYYAKFPLDLIYNKMLFIKTRGTMIPLDPRMRPAQMEMLEIVHEHIEQDIPLLWLIPKARRQGVSTIIEAIIYCLTSQNPNLNATIIADEIKNSTNIFEMTKLYHNKMPKVIKPNLKKSNAKELGFEDMDSLINIDTANKVNIGRSWEYIFIHLSEVAFFGTTAPSIMLGIMQTIPENMFAMVVLESTGNGIGEYFYDKVMASLAGQNDFQVFFISWFKHPDYIKEVPANVDFEYYKEHATYGKEISTAKMLEREGIPNVRERMYWRRWAIKNKCDNDLKKFKQEFPATVEEAFQASGVNKFDVDKVHDLMQYCRLPIFKGMFDKDGNLVSDTNGKVEIWEFPKKYWNRRYSIGIDTGGTWFESENRCADYTVVTVYDRISMVDVARIKVHMKPKFLVELASQLGHYYNNAQITPEINKWASEIDDTGLTIIDYFRETYSNLYMRETVDTTTKQITMKVGFHTNKQTRPLLIDHMETILDEFNETGERINDITVLTEMLSFVVNEKLGKYEHAEGKKDDCLFSQAIARYVAKGMGKPFYKVPGADDIDYEEAISNDAVNAFN